MAWAQLTLNQAQADNFSNTALLYRRLVPEHIPDVEKELRSAGNDGIQVHTIHHTQLHIHDTVNVFDIAVTIGYTIDGGEDQLSTVYFEYDADGKLRTTFS